MEKVTAVVIGAGVIGLACARALAQKGIDTLILERHGRIGSETSSRNSEVIHAGLYYPTGSLKARLCIEGRRRLPAFCERHGVAFRQCGKLIVATSHEQEARLLALKQQGEDNGVEDLRLLAPTETQTLEPALRCTAALLSPSTGIIDSHALMLALLADAESAGATLALNCAVQRATVETDGIVLEVADIGTGAQTRLQARTVINAAGLSAPAVARGIDGLPAEFIPEARYAKGSYYALQGKPPFSRLIYPLPEPGGLGVHLTLDLAGQARFGPDVEWIGAPDYRVDPVRADAFYAEVRRYWPGLKDGALAPAYAGVRPKISGPGEVAADFLVQGPGTHGVPGLINLFGIESPGLTAALSIADLALERLAA